MYRATERATALGWFLSGTLIGPAFGPFLGGIIVTYVSWRVIFWLQTGLAVVAAVGAFFLLPETIYHKKADDLVGHSGLEKTKILAGMINPWRVIRLWEYPNLLLSGLASASLLFNSKQISVIFIAAFGSACWPPSPFPSLLVSPIQGQGDT